MISAQLKRYFRLGAGIAIVFASSLGIWLYTALPPAPRSVGSPEAYDKFNDVSESLGPNGTNTPGDHSMAPAFGLRPPKPSSRNDENRQRDEWDQAAEQITRLSPSEFPDLPRRIMDDLEKLGCKVPQIWPAGGPPHNVISGSFKKKGQIDWAVLCSIQQTSTIRIYWNGHDNNVTELEPAKDRRWLQGMGDGILGFSRYIGAVSPKTISGYGFRNVGKKLPQYDHDGISEAFVEKGSTIFYLHEGKWIEVMGAD